MPRISCPQCHAQYDVAPNVLGQVVQCTNCRAQFNAVDDAAPTVVEKAGGAIWAGVRSAAGAAADMAKKAAADRAARKEAAAAPPAQQPQGPSTWEKFTMERQDPALVAKIMESMQPILMGGEEVMYIAVQQKPVVNIAADAVVLTNQRFLLFKPKMLGGMSFVDHVWRNLGDCQLEEGMFGATLRFQVAGGPLLALDYIPKEQARQVYRIAQQMEEAALEARRQREREDRMPAGGMLMAMPMQMPMAVPAPAPQLQAQQPQASDPNDPVARLKKLKGLLDAQLISQAEFDAKKAEILGNI